MDKFAYLKSLRGRTIPPSAYRVLVEMWNYSDENGRNAYPGAERLSEDTGLTVRAVRKQLAWLEEMGYLIKEKGGGRGRATVYSLALPGEQAPTLKNPAGREIRVSDGTGPENALWPVANDPDDNCPGCGKALEIDYRDIHKGLNPVGIRYISTGAGWHENCHRNTRPNSLPMEGQLAAALQ
ncbi:helix-turn-helix domain-containing protein [Mycobacterium angelicum]|uniref:Helix-turn-helix domain-containing protein n=1 Tax=Mycobacterium angelicum TaxID=470074 RepID=A0A1X0A1S7_MYCAN|nr:helix-turn-helix domain-containing protein [Mycobacterium angelicum]MCV7195398.1 helix-turn-helix domain-containing protein [Mycobacterium angelicum]ORA23838.1 hypothetical protein BST12_06690 [Mycobacterium angelicum]